MLRKTLMGAWATCALMLTHPAVAATSNPDIVLYVTDARLVQGNWAVMADTSAADGSALASANRKWSTPAPLAAPADYIEFTFDAPAGVYYRLWLRLRATSNATNNDSVYVQYSDAIGAGGAPLYRLGTTSGLAIELQDCRRCSLSGWGWQDDRYSQSQVTEVAFANGGPHTLRIQTREDGVILDQVVLSPVGNRTSPPGTPVDDTTIVPRAARPASTPYSGTPAVLPGLIDATRYDLGGASVAFWDTTPGNSGASFRADDVDVEASSEGGYNIGWLVAGEWLKYTVSVQTAGTYLLQMRVASPGRGGTVRLLMDATTLAEPIALPDTGGWQQWQTMTTTVTLPAGVHSLVLVAESNGVTGSVGNIAWFAVATERPYNGRAFPIPGTILSEQFDEGGEGVSYHDTTATNEGGQYRATAVDIEASAAGGFNIGWTADGEWLDYSVDVSQAGSYTLTLALATPLAGPSLHLEIAGARIDIPVATTGGWQLFSPVSVPVTLAAGPQRLRLVFDVGGVNVGSLVFALSTGTGTGPTPPPPTPPPAGFILVGPGDNLQAAIDNARPGETLLLTAGATYSGNFVLPVKSGTSWITIRTNTPDSELPGDSTRITPAQAPLLAKLRSPNNMPVLSTAPGAHHYRLLFLEFQNNAGGYGDIIALGDGGSAQNTLALVPHDLEIDRCYLHGDRAVGQKRGVGLNSAATRIANSWFADFKGVGFDTQAIAGWNGPGPFTLVNNYIEAAGENVMFGGGDPSIPYLVPSDITVRGNYFSRPLAWRNESWTVKNLFELKNAQRVVIDGNVFENHWAQAQPGYAIVFTPRNQDGTAPWSVVQQVSFTNNVVRNVSSGFNILGRDDVHPSQQANDIIIRNNLFENVSTAFGGSGRFMLIAGAANVTVDHNTVIQDGWTSLYSDAAVSNGFTFTNNIIPDYSWAIMGVNTSPGNGTIAAYFPNGLFLGGIFAGSSPWNYPAGNYYPASLAEVGFTNQAARNYRLSATSPYRNGATDGTDVGCQIDALNAAAGTTY